MHGTMKKKRLKFSAHAVFIDDIAFAKYIKV